MSGWRAVPLLSRALAGALGLLLLAAPAVAAPPGKPKPAGTVAGLPVDNALALGERMYRLGLLPSGEPMSSVVNGDVPVAGTAFSCSSCHLRAGLGSWEGGIVTLPTNGARLAIPRYWKFPNLSPEERRELKLQNPAARPAYTDETLAHLLRTGRDPSGYDMHSVMPRYDLSDPDMALLINYLRNLSVRPSPGVVGDTLRFATVIAPGVSEEDQQAMLVPLNNYVARHNQFSAGFGNRMYLGVGGNEMSGAYRKLALSVWRLSGPPETWPAQLDAFLAKEPAFALLGGIAPGEWKPIHDFCERAKLPCLFPITDLPAVSDTDWYTQYFSKGYYQEGQAAARYLHGLDDPNPTRKVLQLVQDSPEGKALAQGFRETWAELGRAAVPETLLPEGKPLALAALEELLAREKPSTVLLWTGSSAFPALAALTQGATGAFLSARLLGGQLTNLPEPVRSQVWITYPYREPKLEAKYSLYADTLLGGLKQRNPETRISTRTYALVQILRQALMDMDRHFYRDNLLDRIGMQRDQILPDYLRLSFGPGQRYASKGCFIMQVGPGPSPSLLRKSEWVIH
jgi:hypothetical protein